MEPAAEGWRLFRCGILCRRELQLQRRERLPQAVMDLARNAGAFVFTDVLLPGGEAAQRSARGTQLHLSPPRIGDVTRNAEKGLDGAGGVAKRDGMGREPAT